MSPQSRVSVAGKFKLDVTEVSQLLWLKHFPEVSQSNCEKLWHGQLWFSPHKTLVWFLFHFCFQTAKKLTTFFKDLGKKRTQYYMWMYFLTGQNSIANLWLKKIAFLLQLHSFDTLSYLFEYIDLSLPKDSF